MGGALGLRAARCEPVGRGLSGAAREQPATVGVGPARTVGGVLRGPRGTRTANGRGIRPLGSGTRLEPSSADRKDRGGVNLRVGVCPPKPRISRWLMLLVGQWFRLRTHFDNKLVVWQTRV